MGRRKIKIQPIQDDRNRQVMKLTLDIVQRFDLNFVVLKGHVPQKKEWTHEEGL